jgi:hypothetical protein
VSILRKLQHGGTVSFRDYQNVFAKENKDFKLLPKSALEDKNIVNVRQALAPEIGGALLGATGVGSNKASIRDVNNLIMATSGFLFMPCTCGLKIKVPPTIGKNQIQCPRCGRYLTVPSITSNISHKEEKTRDIDGAQAVFERKNPDSWETALCDCGHSLQLSPLFRGRQITCKKCKRKIQINYPQ